MLLLKLVFGLYFGLIFLFILRDYLSPKLSFPRKIFIYLFILGKGRNYRRKGNIMKMILFCLKESAFTD